RNRLWLAQGVLTDIVYSHGHGRTGIADRLRECCQSVARASDSTTEGDRRTPGHWSRAFSTDPPISHGKHNARDCRGRPWSFLCELSKTWRTSTRDSTARLSWSSTLTLSKAAIRVQP